MCIPMMMLAGKWLIVKELSDILWEKDVEGDSLSGRPA